MKQKLFLLLIILISFIYSCKNELDVTDVWSENTIVYGVLNTADSIHYLKITKAFLGEGDNIGFAQNPDSSQYHGELEVKIEEFSGINKINTFILDTITVYNKQVGQFYAPKQTLYFFKSKLREGLTYKLEIKNKKTGNITTSHTYIVPSRIINSSGFYLSRPSMNNSVWGINSTYNYTIDFVPTTLGLITQIGINFYYKEILNSDTVIKDIGELKLIQVTGTNNIYKDVPVVEVTKSGQSFYNYINEKLKNNTINKKIGYQIEIIVYVGDENYKKYYESMNNTSLLINEPNVHSNITNGKGLFTAVSINKFKYYISTDMNNELTSNQATKILGFIK